MNLVSPTRTESVLSEPARDAGGATDWWRGAILYQIYPRSFRDTNGDGIGDLPGVIEGLEHIASLGVDGVWISPMFRSPMRDFGYDVSDYCDIDPVFGTLGDFDRLVAKAHGLNLKVIIDQIYSHTSDQHAWFAESRQSTSNPKADWYVWADPKPDGSPPNNWQSVFGPGAWTWESRREQYYFHNFLSCQPDLNLHNMEVQEALLDVARFWLDLGVDGFRLDSINTCMHDPLLRDNPAAPRDGRVVSRPFDLQDHVYSQAHPDIPMFLERIRRLTDEYSGVFTIAEVGNAAPIEDAKSYTAYNRRLNSSYGFDFLYAEEITPNLIKAAVEKWSGDAEDAQPSWAFSNHDAPRATSRWRRSAEPDCDAKFFAMLLMSLRGGVLLYQGEEIGLPQADVPFELLKDPEAIANWPRTLGRDGARTPIPWTMTAPNAGFSDGEPWLPVDRAHYGRAIDVQDRDPRSMLNFTRRLVSVRQDSPSLRHGTLSFLDAVEDVLAIHRAASGEEFACVFNFADHAISWRPPEAVRYGVVLASSEGASASEPPAEIPPRSGYFARRRA